MQRLVGVNVALIFEKASTRTRCAFEVAAYDQGAHVTYLEPAGSHLGHKESAADTGRVLARMYDAIEYRGFSQATVEALAASSGVPVWNGLTDQWHPTQSLCDMFTMREHTDKPDNQICFAYLGDARNNVANSLLVAGALMGMDVRIVAPPSLFNPDDVRDAATAIAAHTGARLTHTSDIATGVARRRLHLHRRVGLDGRTRRNLGSNASTVLTAYQVNQNLLDKTGNPHVKFMHCLPAFHNRDTTVGEQLYQRTGLSALEVTDDVFESPHSIVFDQAENRLHTIKAIMVATLTNPGLTLGGADPQHRRDVNQRPTRRQIRAGADVSRRHNGEE